MKRIYVDSILLDWDAALFNQSPVRRVKARSICGLITSGGLSARTKAKTGEGAAHVRSKLGAFVRRAPEVMVKISGGGKGMNQIKAHLDYISRNGQMEMETEDGERVLGKDEVAILRDNWQTSGYRVKDESAVREAYNIVLSMPEGTDPLGLKRAARDFAAVEFADHEYVMALHTYETDPDPEPARHPHVHLTVKARGFEGSRLNPRKADLQRWREGFAEALRAHGIEAVATSRQQRLKRTRGEKTSVRKMRGRGEALDQVGRSGATDDRIAKARATAASVLKGYREITAALVQSEDTSDRVLAEGLISRLRWERTQGRDERGEERTPAAGRSDRNR